MHIFKNFKSFSNVSLDLMQPMTLMIGRNGAGKSNAIEAVELLAQIAHGRPLHQITDIGRGSGSTFEIRGGLEGCLKQDKNGLGSLGGMSGSFTLGFAAVWKDSDFDYKVTINLSPKAKITEETLVWANEIIFSAKAGKRDDILDVTYNNYRRGGKKPIAHIASDSSVLSRYETFVHFDKPSTKQKDASRLVNIVEKYLNAAFVFDPNPKIMRNYERSGQSILNKDGSNLSSVLLELHRGSDENKETLNRILNRLKQLPDEPFESFEFIETQLKDVLIALKRADGSLADARLLSEGTLRALAILTALETVPENSRIIIEEIDNGIHPSRAEMLVDAIWDCSNRRKLNVFATTHNPATLDCLDAEQIQSVVVCYYDNQKVSSFLTPLTDLPDADVLLERGKLGDLVTHRILEQHLMPGFEEMRKKKTAEWLESLT